MSSWIQSDSFPLSQDRNSPCLHFCDFLSANLKGMYSDVQIFCNFVSYFALPMESPQEILLSYEFGNKYKAMSL